MASAMAVTAVTADSAVWAASAMAASAVWAASAMAVSAVSVATAMVDTAALVASVASAASAISVSTEYCEVNESRDTSLTRFQRLSAQLFQPYAIRPHTFLFSLTLFLLQPFIVSIIIFVCPNSLSVSLLVGGD